VITETAVSSKEWVINAPVESVWAVLVDFENYHQWNRFNPDIKAELVLGTPVVMQVLLGDNMAEITEYMSRIDPCEAIAWRMQNLPDDPIHAERTQYLKRLSDTSCSYLSVDEFSGPGMSDMLAMMGEPVETGFDLAGAGLNQYCEAHFQ
jgi:hypothetical protein